MFPYLTYTRPPVSLFPRKIPTAFVCTMNVSEQMMKENYGAHIGANEHIFGMMFGHAESSFANETLQFEDYDKVVFSYFDPDERKERRKTVFPQDCVLAFELGAGESKNDKNNLTYQGPAEERQHSDDYLIFSYPLGKSPVFKFFTTSFLFFIFFRILSGISLNRGFVGWQREHPHRGADG